jgi:hydroxymethylpyrimidine pyrophosphatase-like HAD family hydrolase
MPHPTDLPLPLTAMPASARAGIRYVLTEIDDELAAAVFIGDSPNDEAMFGYFPHSIAVANVRPFMPRLKARPAYVTAAEAGAGFVEFAEALLS